MLRERTLVLSSLVVWITIAVLALVVNAPLGHDESQYAVAARAETSPWLYLSPGSVAIAWLGRHLGDAAWALRLVPAVLGIAFLVATWWLGRVAFGAHVGAYAAAIVAGAHSIVLRNAELLGDLPAAAALLFACAVIVRELERGPTWRLVVVAPLCAAAFYIRYASAPEIAIIAATACVVWWRRILARPWPVLAALLAFLALLVPHFVFATRATGSPLGILTLSSGVPYRGYVGEGLVTYMTSNPLVYYGVLAAPALLAGVIATLRPPAAWRTATFLGLSALGQFVALGMQTRAQPRYVAFAVAALVVVGIDGAIRALRSRPATLWQAFRIARVIVPLAWFGVTIAAVPRNLMLAHLRAPIEDAASAIRAASGGKPCVVAGTNVPELMWRTRCAGTIASARTRWPTDRDAFLVALPHDEHEIAPLARRLDAAAVPIPQHARPRVWRLPHDR